MKNNKEIIKVPDKLMIYTDKMTGVRTVAFPIIMPDGVPGALAITHLKNELWNPFDMISEITIKYKNI